MLIDKTRLKIKMGTILAGTKLLNFKCGEDGSVIEFKI